MKGRAEVVAAATKYRAAISNTHPALEAFREQAKKELERAVIQNGGWSTKYSELRDAASLARTHEQRARDEFYSAVDRCPSLRWRLLDEFAPDQVQP